MQAYTEGREVLFALNKNVGKSSKPSCKLENDCESVLISYAANFIRCDIRKAPSTRSANFASLWEKPAERCRCILFCLLAHLLLTSPRTCEGLVINIFSNFSFSAKKMHLKNKAKCLEKLACVDGA